MINVLEIVRIRTVDWIVQTDTLISLCDTHHLLPEKLAPL